MTRKLTNEELIQKVVELEAEVAKYQEAGKELIVLKKKFQAIFDNAADSIFIIDPINGSILDCNENAAKQRGYTKEELLKLKVFDINIEQVQPAIPERFKKQIAGEKITFETVHRHKKGHEIPVEISSTFIKFNGQKLLVSSARDLSERQKTFRVLAKSEKKFRQFVENTSEGVGMMDKNARIIYANRSMCEMFGYPEDELIGRSPIDFLDEENLEIFKKYIEIRKKGLVDSVKPYGISFIKKDGSILHTIIAPQIIKDSDGSLEGSFALITDITERQKLEESLKESEEKYRKIFNNEIDAISIFNIETRKLIDANDAFLNLYGYTREEVLKLTVDDISAEPDSSKKAIKKSAVEGDTLILRRLHKKKDGSEITVELSAGPFTWKGEKVMFAVVRDITFRVKAIEALSESEEKYKSLFNYSSDGIIVHDLKSNIIDVNKMALDLCGYTRDEILKLKVMDLHPPEMLEKAKDAFREIATERHVNFEIFFKKKNGELFPAAVSSALVEIDGQKIIQGLVRDITERKKLEEEFQKVQKLESTGVLAGGIAHDFNNILTAILGNISMAKIFAGSNEKVLNRLVEAEKASMRAQDLSQQLLTFSKGGEPVKKSIKITELIKDSASFSLTGSNVKCNLFMADKLWPVNIDEGQISQVIQNVVKNADQAMPDGGTIIIKAENKIISGMDTFPLKKGKYVWITIKDQGGGIPKKHISKIFDPYFSTKQEGSGLGLAASFSIVKKHDGHISAESEPGEGTTFHIYLPASEKVSPVKKRVKEKSLQSGEKILIMDDDQAVLEIATQMLNMMGFKTETATNGQEAIALYKKAQKGDRPFGAVLLDLTIPGGMGGKETVKQLAHIDPEVKAIVSSGYSNDPIMADYKNFGFSSVVSKPYDIEKLGEALRVLFS